MKYVCVRCGKMLDEPDVVIDPDGDAECEGCYEENKADWFVEEDEEEPGESEQPEEIKPDDLTGAIDTKKPFWKK